MNVNVHLDGKYMNLGLARIRNSFTSEACLTTLREKLQQYNLNLDADVLAVVTDGAEVMKKFGRISGRYHQLCMAHGIHLAVTDVLYKKTTNFVNQGGQHETDSNDLFGLSQESNIPAVHEEVDDVDNADEESTDEKEDENDAFQPAQEEEILYEQNISDVIKHVQLAVNFFRKSALRTETLVKNSGKQNSKTLRNDSRTRWNSLVTMLQRVLDLKEAIKKSYINIQMACPITDEDFDVVATIVSVLEPVQLAAEAICMRTTSLITADAVIVFMFGALEKCQSELAKDIILALKRRLGERRSILSNVASYLHYRKDEAIVHQKGYFPKSSKTQIAACLKEMYEKFHGTPEDANVPDTETQASEGLILEMGLATELRLVIREAETFKHVPVASRRDTIPTIRNEMRIFETGGAGGKIINFAYAALKTTPPSTVESERVFSSANNFCTKLRTRLNDESLDALSFLKWYFLNKSE